MINPLWIIMIIVNTYAFGLMAMDKRRAKRHGRRVSERSLLFLSLFGGGMGAFLGSLLLRHKTRKMTFKVLLPLGCITSAILYYCLFTTLQIPMV